MKMTLSDILARVRAVLEDRGWPGVALGADSPRYLFAYEALLTVAAELRRERIKRSELERRLQIAERRGELLRLRLCREMGLSPQDAWGGGYRLPGDDEIVQRARVLARRKPRKKAGVKVHPHSPFSEAGKRPLSAGKGHDDREAGLGD